MPDSERRRYEELQEILVAFQAGSLPLSDLIDRLPPIIKSIAPPQEWKDEFVSYWWTLEQVHEEAIEVGESRRLPPERRIAVDTSIQGMQRLVEGVLTSTS